MTNKNDLSGGLSADAYSILEHCSLTTSSVFQSQCPYWEIASPYLFSEQNGTEGLGGSLADAFHLSKFIIKNMIAPGMLDSIGGHMASIETDAFLGSTLQGTRFTIYTLGWCDIMSTYITTTATDATFNLLQPATLNKLNIGEDINKYRMQAEDIGAKLANSFLYNEEKNEGFNGCSPQYKGLMYRCYQDIKEQTTNRFTLIGEDGYAELFSAEDISPHLFNELLLIYYAIFPAPLELSIKENMPGNIGKEIAKETIDSPIFGELLFPDSYAHALGLAAKARTWGEDYSPELEQINGQKFTLNGFNIRRMRDDFMPIHEDNKSSAVFVIESMTPFVQGMEGTSVGGTITLKLATPSTVKEGGKVVEDLTFSSGDLISIQNACQVNLLRKVTKRPFILVVASSIENVLLTQDDARYLGSNMTGYKREWTIKNTKDATVTIPVTRLPIYSDKKVVEDAKKAFITKGGANTDVDINKLAKLGNDFYYQNCSINPIGKNVKTLGSYVNCPFLSKKNLKRCSNTITPVTGVTGTSVFNIGQELSFTYRGVQSKLNQHTHYASYSFMGKVYCDPTLSISLPIACPDKTLIANTSTKKQLREKFMTINTKAVS